MRHRLWKAWAISGTWLFIASAQADPAQKTSRTPEAAASAFHAAIDKAADAVLPKVVAWRRDFHEHPELGNSEVRTAKVVADELKALGLEVKTGIARTGVVALLRGGKPGPVVALRSDMDALPVTEVGDLPFRSRVTATWAGQQTGVMHACGHDLHMAMLLGTAHVLAGLKDQLAGSVKFIFQPAEEGPPPGEEGGASLMVKEGAMENPKVDAIFGLHVFPDEVGTIGWRARGIMAQADTLRITVKGRQTHGAVPWGGVDPIVVSAQIVLGLQTLISRQADLAKAPAVLTIGAINGGNRQNIIPEEVKMLGTLRTFDPQMRDDLLTRIRRTISLIAQSAGATADVTLGDGYPVTYNDPALTARMDPTLRRIAGERSRPDVTPRTAAEDFSYFQREAPGLFLFLGVTPKGTPPEKVFENHSPYFFADEGALITGVRVMSNLAVDYLMR